MGVKSVTLDRGFWWLPWVWDPLLQPESVKGEGKSRLQQGWEDRKCGFLLLHSHPKKKVRNKDAHVLTMGAKREPSFSDWASVYRASTIARCYTRDSVATWSFVIKCTQGKNVRNPLPQDLVPAGNRSKVSLVTGHPALAFPLEFLMVQLNLWNPFLPSSSCRNSEVSEIYLRLWE